jgi:glutamyl-tRNA reductase
MQDPVTHPPVIQSLTQPFLKLIRANMDLLSGFSMSSADMSQSLTDAQRLVQQGQSSLTNLFRSKEFADLMQGMLKNYTEFLTETGQNALAMLTQGQQAATRQVEEGSAKVIDATDALAKRSTKAA